MIRGTGTMNFAPIGRRSERLHAARKHLSHVLAALCLICISQPRVAFGQVGDLALPTQMELSRLVDLAADRLAVSIDYDAAALKAVATLRMAEGVDARELWTLTNRVLVTRGLTTVRLPGERAYAVVRLAEAAGVAQVMSEDDARLVLLGKLPHLVHVDVAELVGVRFFPGLYFTERRVQLLQR